MPNVIVELTREIARVKALLPSLGPTQIPLAERELRLADVAMASNSFENMRESIDALRYFTGEPSR